MAHPMLITIDFHLIVCLGLSHKFHLGPHHSGSRIMIGLTKDAGLSQNTLWLAIFKKEITIRNVLWAREEISPSSSPSQWKGGLELPSIRSFLGDTLK